MPPHRHLHAIPEAVRSPGPTHSLLVSSRFSTTTCSCPQSPIRNLHYQMHKNPLQWPLKDTSTSQPPALTNKILFGDRDFADVTELRISRCCHFVLRWALNSMTSVMRDRREKNTQHSRRPREDGGRVWSGRHKPRNAWSPQEMEEAGRIFSQCPGGNVTLPTP